MYILIKCKSNKIRKNSIISVLFALRKVASDTKLGPIWHSTISSSITMLFSVRKSYNNHWYSFFVHFSWCKFIWSLGNERHRGRRKGTNFESIHKLTLKTFQERDTRNIRDHQETENMSLWNMPLNLLAWKRKKRNSIWAQSKYRMKI